MEAGGESDESSPEPSESESVDAVEAVDVVEAVDAVEAVDVVEAVDALFTVSESVSVAARSARLRARVVAQPEPPSGLQPRGRRHPFGQAASRSAEGSSAA